MDGVTSERQMRTTRFTDAFRQLHDHLVPRLYHRIGPNLPRSILFRRFLYERGIPQNYTLQKLHCGWAHELSDSGMPQTHLMGAPPPPRFQLVFPRGGPCRSTAGFGGSITCTLTLGAFSPPCPLKHWLTASRKGTCNHRGQVYYVRRGFVISPVTVN